FHSIAVAKKTPFFVGRGDFDDGVDAWFFDTQSRNPREGRWLDELDRCGERLATPMLQRNIGTRSDVHRVAREHVDCHFERFGIANLEEGAPSRNHAFALLKDLQHPTGAGAGY